jgi:hypothetical protein
MAVDFALGQWITNSTLSDSPALTTSRQRKPWPGFVTRSWGRESEALLALASLRRPPWPAAIAPSPRLGRGGGFGGR